MIKFGVRGFSKCTVVYTSICWNFKSRNTLYTVLPFIKSATLQQILKKSAKEKLFLCFGNIFLYVYSYTLVFTIRCWRTFVIIFTIFLLQTSKFLLFGTYFIYIYQYLYNIIFVYTQRFTIYYWFLSYPTCRCQIQNNLMSNSTLLFRQYRWLHSISSSPEIRFVDPFFQRPWTQLNISSIKKKNF